MMREGRAGDAFQDYRKETEITLRRGDALSLGWKRAYDEVLDVGAGNIILGCKISKRPGKGLGVSAVES